ncbi:MAG: ureidoglycolate lyase [Gammaproteobacteria bacterium]
MAILTLHAEPLDKTVFAPFGDVIELAGSRHYPINAGTTERFHDLARVDVLENGGRPLINIFRTQPAPQPIKLRLMERHPLASQAFMPLSNKPFLVVVAAPGAAPTAANLRAFVTTGEQGVNYHRGVWHHPALALNEVTDFVVVDRGGPGHNCDEAPLADEIVVTL